jgi:hypothetical protein
MPIGLVLRRSMMPGVMQTIGPLPLFVIICWPHWCLGNGMVAANPLEVVPKFNL